MKTPIATQVRPTPLNCLLEKWFICVFSWKLQATFALSVGSLHYHGRSLNVLMALWVIMLSNVWSHVAIFYIYLVQHYRIWKKQHFLTRAKKKFFWNVRSSSCPINYTTFSGVNWIIFNTKLKLIVDVNRLLLYLSCMSFSTINYDDDF